MTVDCARTTIPIKSGDDTLSDSYLGPHSNKFPFKCAKPVGEGSVTIGTDEHHNLLFYIWEENKILHYN